MYNSTFTAFTLEKWNDSNLIIADEDKNWSISEDLTNKKITVSNGHGKTADLYFYGDRFDY